MTADEARLAAALLMRRESDHYGYMWPRTEDDWIMSTSLWDLATQIEDDVRRRSPDAYESACAASHAWVYGGAS